MKSIKTILDSISSLEGELTSLNIKLEQEKDNMFNSIVEISPNFTAITQNEKFVFVNSAGQSLLKCSKSCDIIGKSVYDFLHPDIHLSIKERFENLEFNDTSNPLKIQVLSTDGNSICMEVTSKSFTYNNTLAALIIGRDVTQEVIQKQKLIEAEQRYREIFDYSNESLFLLEVLGDSRFCTLEVNPQFEKEVGLTREMCIGKTMEEAASADMAAEINVKFQRCVDARTEIEEDIELQFPNGKRYFHSNLVPIFDENGNVRRISGIARDITERKQLDELLKKRQKNLEEAQRIGKIGSWELDLHLNKIERSEETCRIYELDPFNTGASPEESLSIIHPDDRDKVCIAHANSVRNMKPYQIEYRLLFADGRIKSVTERCETFYDESGNPLRSVGTVQDITEQKQRQEEIEMLGFALNNAYNAVFISEENTINFSYVNDQACRLLGYSREELLGMTIFDIDPDATVDLLKQIDTDIALGKTSIIETGHKRKDGAVVPVQITTTRYQHNNKTYVMNIVQDISERKKKQNELIEAEEKRRESERRYREIFDNSHDSIYLLEILEDSHFRLLAVNAQYEKEIGVTSEQCVGNTMEEHVGSEVAVIVNAKYQRCIDAGTIIEEILELDMALGKRTYHSTLIPIRNNKSEIYRIMGVTRDITDELRNERELETSRNLLSNAELVASLGNFYMDFSNSKFRCSKGIYNILGLTFKEEENLDVFKFVHPDDIEWVKKQLNCAFETKIKFDEILRIIDHYGSEKVVHATGSFVTDSLDAELFLCNFQDVSNIHSLKKQIVIGEGKFKMLAENSPLGILILNGRTPLFINQALLDLSGVCSLKEFNEINPIDLVHPDDRNSLLKLTDKLFEDKNEEPTSYQLTVRSLGLNGKQSVFDLRFTTCWMADSKYLQIVVIDISDEIEKETFLSQLASDSLYISQKNCTILSIKHELDEILKVKCLRCSDGPDFRNILKILDQYSNADCDWGLFNKQFENLHPEFILNLNIICPSLTTYDIKHCACIRLDLDTKEIAVFFNVEPASIQKSRVRLKKKLGLPQNVDLREFIMCL